MPALVSTRDSLASQSNSLRETALDAKYTSDSLKESLDPALKSLQRISALISSAREDVTKALEAPQQP